MPILQVRNVPKDMYSDLKQIAGKRTMSLSGLVLALLRRGLVDEKWHDRHSKALNRLRKNIFKPKSGSVDTTAMIREDRDR